MPEYEHAEKKTIQEIPFLLEKTCRTSDLRWKKNWRMQGLDGEEFTKSWQQTVSWSGETEEEFEKRVEICLAAYEVFCQGKMLRKKSGLQNRPDYSYHLMYL